MHEKIFKLSALSLIEILITITIVLILCAASIYTYQDYKVKALYNSALNTMEQNKLIVSSFYAKNKKCPDASFINQSNFSTQSIASSITNDPTNHCTLNLNGSGAIILSYVAMITDLGDLQYYCVLARKSSTARPSAPDIEKFLAFCNDPEPPTNFVPPGTPPSNT